MLKATLFIIVYSLVINFVVGQNLNGKIDDLSELTTIIEVPFTMPDGTRLMSDVYLPITQDSMVVEFDIAGIGNISLEIIPRGEQYIVYDSINGELNDNPYQLPLIFARTPYDKSDESLIEESIFTLMGFGYILQDMRGRGRSEGVYLPMYSDSWNKNSYHPELKHINDITDLSSEINGNKHEDGYNSIKFIKDSLYRFYKQDTFLIGNGSIGMVGYSALGNSQYQAASARKINPEEDGLKCLFPIAATNEYYHSTGFHNGVYRQSLVERWVRGQMYSLDDEQTADDNSLQNNLHTPADFGVQTISEVAEKGIEYFTSFSADNQLPAYFPNSIYRYDLDASVAVVDEFGEGDLYGHYSRYGNMEVPIYHLTGWWDIFINGQIDTYNFLMQNLSSDYGNKSLQKLVVGPWAHQTIGKRKTGDITYKENINDFILATDNIFDDEGHLTLDKIVNSDVLQWFKWNLNSINGKTIAEPKVILAESDKWQKVNDNLEVRIPASDCLFSIPEFLNYLSGHFGLPNINVEIRRNNLISPFEIEIPKLSEPLLSTTEPIDISEVPDFRKIPRVRLYVPGPINDGIIENNFIGNYWLKKDSFPFFQDISNTKFYLHKNGKVDDVKPLTDEGDLTYFTDPNNPVLTVGGNNMRINSPDGLSKSQGQKNLANKDVIDQTMNHEGVLEFESDFITDSISIVGIPVATLFASCEPLDSTIKLTDTDFFVRVLDVYPNNEEYFVVEGAVNARARMYAKKLASGVEDVNTPFENIRINKIYEFQFKMLPIAYTFGKGHKIRILISSSNYPRYQVNANVPVNDSEFVRRRPNDGQIFDFNGMELNAREVVHKIAFSNNYPSNIEFPVLGNRIITTNVSKPVSFKTIDFSVYPNPANNYFICTNNLGVRFGFEVFDLTGQKKYSSKIDTEHRISTELFDNGIYLIRFVSENRADYQSKKLIVFY